MVQLDKQKEIKEYMSVPNGYAYIGKHVASEKENKTLYDSFVSIITSLGGTKDDIVETEDAYIIANEELGDKLMVVMADALQLTGTDRENYLKYGCE